MRVARFASFRHVRPVCAQADYWTLDLYGVRSNSSTSTSCSARLCSFWTTLPTSWGTGRRCRGGQATLRWCIDLRLGFLARIRHSSCVRLCLSASSVKHWFQYRCERKLVYETMDREARAAIPIAERTESAPWAEVGVEYEREVVAAYAAEAGVRMLWPRAGRSDLGEEMSLGFLRGVGGYTVAHQLALTGTLALRQHLGLESVDVDFRRGFVDLVLVTEVHGRRRFRLVDVKSTHEALSFHKLQVAWYAWMLRGVLEENGIEGEVDREAEIWHRPKAGGGPPCERTVFWLRSYESIVLDWTGRELRGALKRTVRPGKDDTQFHVYFKCEQCRFLPHCERAISDDLAPAQWDVSAVAGLSHTSKASLRWLGIRTVGDFARERARVLSRDVTDWSLSTSGAELVARADALLRQEVRRMPGRVTLRMPPCAEVKVFLVADKDPMTGRLATLAARVIEGEVERWTEIRTISSLAEEAIAIREVLAPAVATLRAVDARNRGGAASILHIYVYEPAESRDLAEAMARHLGDPEILRTVLELVRMFPSEQTLPEPEYRGHHHLPSCALRSVLEDLYAIPAKVSYDLANVSRSLAALRDGPRDGYAPAEAFARPFSSRLALSQCRDLEEGRAERGAIEQDVAARLSAMVGLATWLEKTNARTQESDRFLRLDKKPFRLHALTDPLRAPDLDVLRAQSLLASRAGLMEALERLAEPVDRRRARRACIADLRLLDFREGPRSHWLIFEAPGGSHDAELRPGDLMLLLTHGHPDHLLDPALWSDVRVELADAGSGGPRKLALRITARTFESKTFQTLWARRTEPWILDKGFADYNTDRLQKFFSDLDAGADS